jgi:putative endonuclease
MQRRTSTSAQRTSAQRIGDDGEALAAARLEAAGWTVLARNLRLGRDELDLVAVDPGPPRTLVVVEVRRRGRRDFGLAEETLDHRKRAALRRGVGALMGLGTLPDGTPLPSLPLRVDLVAIDPSGDGTTSLRHHRGIRP